MKAERLLAALAYVAPPVFEAHGMRPDCCVAATRAGVEVLGRWGIKARPMLCEAEAFNAPWRAGDRTPGRAWAVAIDAQSVGDGLAGHLVIVGKMGREHFLLDLSARQMHRPHKGIFIPQGLCIRTGGPLMDDCWSVGADLPEGGGLAYRAHPSPEIVRYQTAPDWKLPTPGHRQTHASVVSALRLDTEHLVRKSVARQHAPTHEASPPHGDK
jgi:hypothetical protein